MKLKSGIIAVISALLCMQSATVLPASAAEADQTVYPESACPDFEPVSNDTITFSGLPSGKASVRIVQHSPERENLVLYDTELKCEKGCTYIFRTEPGKYTVTIGAANISGGASMAFYQQDITIDNADYSKDPQFSKTNVSIAASYQQTKDDTAAEGEKTGSVVKYTDSIKQDSIMLTFPQYNRIRGDYNGDGIIDSIDAQLTLIAYAEDMVGNEVKVQPAAAAACDINGNQALDLIDAQHILNYYTEALAANTPLWFDEQ